MIFLKDRNLAIVTPLKTGSTSLHSHLCSPSVGGFYVLGPQGDCAIEKHTTHVPMFGTTSPTRSLMVVRDPIQRAASMWFNLRFFEPATSFDQLYECIRTNPLYCNLSENYFRCGAVDYLRLESINEDLAKYGLPPLELRENQSDSKPTLTHDQIERLRWWWEPDARQFGYQC